MYELRIKHLEESHRALDKQIDTLEKTGVFEDLKLEELKKQRLHLKTILLYLDINSNFTHRRNNGSTYF